MLNKISVAILAVMASPLFASADNGSSASGLVAIGAGIAIGAAALGGALGQGKTVSAALEAIGRNPAASGKAFAPMILGLVLIESLVIFAFVIANGLAGKV
jgi:F-type H+-transporting ATPase subunit c